MKRYIGLLLVFSLLLSGCSLLKPQETTVSTSDTLPPVQSTAAPETTDAISTAPVILDGPLTAVSVPSVTDTAAADDGTTLFTYSHQTMHLTMEGQGAADRIIVDFLNRIDAVQSTADSILTSAKADYSGQYGWIPYFCQVSYDPTRIDPGVMSLFGKIVTFNGASHPEQTCVAANYDMLTGNVLTLGSILKNADSKEPLQELVIQKLQELAEEKNLREGFEADVRQRFAVEESYDQDWYFSDAGLCFYFSPYEIAPYSSGVIVAQVPYSELVGIIDDAFFPGEQLNLAGTVSTAPFDVDQVQQYQQISELILDKEGQMHLVSADSSVQQVYVTVSDSQTGEGYTAYAAQYLNPDSAIMIQAATEILETIQIHYVSSGQVQTIPLV